MIGACSHILAPLALLVGCLNCSSSHSPLAASAFSAISTSFLARSSSAILSSSISSSISDLSQVSSSCSQFTLTLSNTIWRSPDSTASLGSTLWPFVASRLDAAGLGDADAESDWFRRQVIFCFTHFGVCPRRFILLNSMGDKVWRSTLSLSVYHVSPMS
ncbi:hypothetical protein BDN71DRAFT_105129 [Pleurotus eryngii]|uniref:Secreted protein n=1 Tax=Pleurotus eryngii TaxID=5323 RepID=A0A9P5ZSL1_PLEER|nr:hypothetical protein BDN71DRAFT_105129 [Pleurotus eryngii]